MEIIKTVIEPTKEGVCYGVVVNPEDHSVTKHFRDLPTVTINPKDFTEKQKTVTLAFLAEFLTDEAEMDSADLLTALSADLEAKIAPVEEPKEIEK